MEENYTVGQNVVVRQTGEELHYYADKTVVRVLKIDRLPARQKVFYTVVCANNTVQLVTESEIYKESELQ